MNVEKIRQDFPLLNKGKKEKIIYFDNACMTLKPMQVIETMNRYYEEFPACSGRSAHRLAAKVEEEYGNARKRVAKFMGAKREEVIFTKNTTESINLVSYSIGLGKDDIVITTDKEHNSNLLPWQDKDFRHIIFKMDDEFDLDAFEKFAAENKPRLVSMVHCSNVDSSMIPAKEIAKIVHDSGGLFMLDAAQSVPHMDVTLNGTGTDLIAFSGHKMLGPSIGVLCGRKNVLEKMDPFIRGGGTVQDTTYEEAKYMPVPDKFEAGLQNYAGAIGLAAAIEYLENIGMKNVERHEEQLTKILDESLRNMNSVDITGPSAEKRRGITSFTVKNVGMHQVAMMLDQMAAIAVRSGQHCVHSWFNARSLEGSVRASLYLYNTKEEIEKFEETMKKIVKLG